MRRLADHTLDPKSPADHAALATLDADEHSR